MKARVLELETAAASSGPAIKQLEATVQELKGKLTEAEGKVQSLTTDLQKANAKANAVIAGQGISAADVPAAEAPATGVPGAKSENMYRKYAALLAKDPRAAGEFYAAHADAILRDRIEK